MNSSSAVARSTTHTIGGKGVAKAPMASEMPAMAKARASRFLENLLSASVGCLLGSIRGGVIWLCGLRQFKSLHIRLQPSFAEWQLWNIRAFPTSVRFDVGELDHFAPFVCFVGHEFSEGGRCHRHRLSSQSKKPRFDNRISKGRVDPIVELVDDRHWCVFGRAEPIPT